MSTTVWIILAGAVATYLTRIGGDIVLSRFERIHPRIEAALNAVPAAVLTTLVAPVATTGGIPEISALVVAGLIFLRIGGLITGLVAGIVVLLLLRNVIG